MNSTGASAGLTLRYDGGAVISSGSCALRAQQRRLHVDRGGVDVAALVELERHRGAAERAASS